MRIYAFATLLLIALLRAPAALAGFGDYVAHELDGATLVIRSDVGELRLTVIDDAAFEVHYVEAGLRQLPSFALADDLRYARAALDDEPDRLIFAAPHLTALVHKSPLSLEFLRDGQSLLAEEHGYFAYDTLRGFRFGLDEGEKIFGGGMRVLGMDRRGERMPLYNRAHYEYETHSSQMYYSLPAVMSTDRYAIIFDNSASGWLDIGHRETDVLQFEAVGGRTAYLVVAGRSYRSSSTTSPRLQAGSRCRHAGHWVTLHPATATARRTRSATWLRVSGARPSRSTR